MQRPIHLPDDPMQSAAEDAAGLLRALSNPGRLRILCALVPGPATVGALERQLGASQSYVSGQLLRLRNEGLVHCTRDGRRMHYALADARVRPVLERLYEVFCPDEEMGLTQHDPDDHGHQPEHGDKKRNQVER